MKFLTPRRRASTGIKRTHHRAFRCTVIGTENLTPRMRRVTLQAEELRSLEQRAADEFFALMIPGPRGLNIPENIPAGTPPRAVAALIPEAERPTLRWYTIRAHRPDSGEVDVDMVLHGADGGGPGGRWAAQVKPGDTVGFCEGNGLYSPPEYAEHQVFFADETALPALAALLESQEPGEGLHPLPPAGTTVHIEVPDSAEIQSIETPVSVNWHVRGGAKPGTALLDALPHMSLPEQIDYVWICAEAAMVKNIRRHMVKQRAVEKESIFFSGYWRLGEERN